MTREINTAQTCRHCGGTLIDRFEDARCLQCGRVSGHVCPACIYPEATPKPDMNKKQQKANAV